MSNINVMRKNLGPVTAYKYAVQQGYTGTEQEFAALMASYATVAEEAEAAKDDAVDAKTAAEVAQAAAEEAASQAEGAITVDDTLSVEGRAADAAAVGKTIDGLRDDLSGIVSRKLIQQSDLVLENSNFVVNNGTAYAETYLSPYNCMAVNAKRIDFKYRRRNNSSSFYIGVLIDGKFVGNRTNASVSEIKTLYGTTNILYTNAVVNESVADDVYSGTKYNDYSATLNGQVFELKKDETTILKFTVADGIEIQGIAFLNYYFTLYLSDNTTDFKDGTIISDKVGEKIASADQKADHAEIIGISSNHRMVAGVIRNAGNGWEFIINDRHQGDMNCMSVGVSESDGRLYVDYSGINVKKVISFIVCPDEAFANQGYVIGSSVGLTAAYIQIFQYVLNAVSADINVNNDGTIEVASADSGAGTMSASWDSTNSRLTITHPEIPNAGSGGAPYISLIPRMYGRYIIRLYSSSGSSAVIEFWDANTNSKVTELNSRMSFNYNRFGSLLVKKEIDPATLISASGNIWFLGIFEV